MECVRSLRHLADKATYITAYWVLHKAAADDCGKQPQPLERQSPGSLLGGLLGSQRRAQWTLDMQPGAGIEPPTNGSGSGPAHSLAAYRPASFGLDVL